MSKSKIKTLSVEDFYDAIAALVERGLSFEADLASLEITLTGGY